MKGNIMYFDMILQRASNKELEYFYYLTYRW